MKIFLPIIICAIFSANLFSQQNEIATLRNLQDQRTQSTEKILPYLSSQSSKVRAQALLALANRQDISAVEHILLLLNDSVTDVRAMSAFALALIGDSSATYKLFQRLKIETNKRCTQELFNAIGMCGRKDDLQKLIGDTDFVEKHLSDIALAVARFANRGIKDSLVTEFLYKKIDNAAAKKNIIYALLRIGNAKINAAHSLQIITLTQSKDAEERMWCASLLASAKDSASVACLFELVQNDKDWRVKVNALRALRTNADNIQIYPVLYKSIKDKNEHVSLTALSVISQITQEKNFIVDSLALMSVVKNAKFYSVRQRGEAIVILAKIYNEQCENIIKRELQTNSDLYKVKLVEALRYIRTNESINLFRTFLHSQNSRIVISAMNSYQFLASSDSSLHNNFLSEIAELFAKKDAGILYEAAMVFQDSSFSAANRKIHLLQMRTSFAQMKGSDDIEPMLELMKVFAQLQDTLSIPLLLPLLSSDEKIIRNEAQKTLFALTGKNYTIPDLVQTKLQTKIELNDIEYYRGAIIETSQGEITISFLPNAAPFTVQNFISLVKKSFYNNLSFHRVVSNFVVQGGDPLGNGSGGPGYSIRTEVHPNLRYVKAGIVGMASAGKDTEGSQFFITHCATPHLDGRYTIFAETKDLEIVNKIMVGDTIKKVILLSCN